MLLSCPLARSIQLLLRSRLLTCSLSIPRSFDVARSRAREEAGTAALALGV